MGKNGSPENFLQDYYRLASVEIRVVETHFKKHRFLKKHKKPEKLGFKFFIFLFSSQNFYIFILKL